MTTIKSFSPIIERELTDNDVFAIALVYISLALQNINPVYGVERNIYAQYAEDMLRNHFGLKSENKVITWHGK